MLLVSGCVSIRNEARHYDYKQNFKQEKGPAPVNAGWSMWKEHNNKIQVAGIRVYRSYYNVCGREWMLKRVANCECIIQCNTSSIVHPVTAGFK